MRGLSIQSSALDALLNVLSREQELVGGGGGSGGNRRRNGDDALLAIIDEIKERMIHSGGCSSDRNNIVTSALLEEVVAELSRDAKDVTDEALQLLDAFRTPRLEYDAMRKTFSLVDAKQRSLYGEAVDKVCHIMFRSNIASKWNQPVYFLFLLTSGGHVLPKIRSHSTTNIATRYFPTQIGGHHGADVCVIRWGNNSDAHAHARGESLGSGRRALFVGYDCSGEEEGNDWETCCLLPDL